MEASKFEARKADVLGECEVARRSSSRWSLGWNDSWSRLWRRWDGGSRWNTRSPGSAWSRSKI